MCSFRVKKTKGAMHGDKVLVVIEQESDGGRRAEGSIVRILEHANQELVGLYEKNGVSLCDPGQSTDFHATFSSPRGVTRAR